jgi:type III secretion system HrpB2-like protein
MSTFESFVTRVAALEPVSGAVALSGNATPVAPAHALPPAAEPAQADRFSQMMEAVHVRNTAASGLVSRPSEMSELVSAQDRSFNGLAGSVESFEQNSPHLSMPEMTAQAIDLQYRVTQAMIKVEVGIGFAQGGKGAVQNLMKSQ